MFFFVCFLLLFGGFFFLCVFIFVWKKTKRLFTYSFRVFFVSPKGLSLKSFFSSYSVFFSDFPFVFPFKTPFFVFVFCPSTPFGKTLIFLVSLSYFFLPFPFLTFACFFQTNFPNIPFLKPKLLSFWLFIYFFCYFGFLIIFHVSAFLFWCWLCFWYVLFCSCLVFVLFLLCFQRLWKTLISLQF